MDDLRLLVSLNLNFKFHTGMSVPVLHNIEFTGKSAASPGPGLSTDSATAVIGSRPEAGSPTNNHDRIECSADLPARLPIL